MDTPLRVLIVEDSADDAALLVRELRRGGYEPSHRCVDSAEALIAALDSQAWDLILCDYTMSGFSGTQALSLVRSRGLDMPFIFVRSEERRVGKECVRKCRLRWSPVHLKKKKKNE